MTLDHAGRLHRHHGSGAAELVVRSRYAGLALAVVCLCAFTTAVDITITDVALPFIARDLHADTSELQWVVDAYTLVFAALLLLAGALGDRYGRRRTLAFGLDVFGVSSAAAA